MKLSSNTNQQGFTLVELMITLAVAAILLGVAAPSFTEMVQNNRISTQANQFIAAMNLARSEAIKRGVNIDVIATSPASGDEWGGGWSIAVNGGDTLKVFPALEGSSVLDSDAGTETFQYQPTGRASVTDAFRLCDGRSGETGREITISTTGRVSVSDYDC